MTKQEIFERLQKTISEQLGIEKNLIKIDTNLAQEFGMDSLDMVDMFYRTKKEFSIKTDTATEEDLVMEKFSLNPTPLTLINFIEEQTKKSAINKNVAVAKTKLTFLQKIKQKFQKTRN